EDSPGGDDADPGEIIRQSRYSRLKHVAARNDRVGDVLQLRQTMRRFRFDHRLLRLDDFGVIGDHWPWLLRLLWFLRLLRGRVRFDYYRRRRDQFQPRVFGKPRQIGERVGQLRHLVAYGEERFFRFEQRSLSLYLSAHRRGDGARDLQLTFRNL